MSTDNTGGTSAKSGTSMASPHAVGCAALLIEAGVVATPAEIEARLKTSPVQVFVNNLGFPRIDCRIPSDRPSVGGATSFLDSGSKSYGISAVGIAILIGTVSGVLAVLAVGGWYGRRRWLGKGTG